MSYILYVHSTENAYFINFSFSDSITLSDQSFMLVMLALSSFIVDFLLDQLILAQKFAFGSIRGWPVRENSSTSLYYGSSR